jgi:acetyl/propionyl-CoA carboxylase alpha subunit
MSVTANGYSNGAEAAPPKVLVANRGEIALRIMRTAKKLGIPSIAIYTLADAETPHVRMADEAHQIGDGTDPRGYLDIEAIVEIAKKSGATLVAPGYGFLSENAVRLSHHIGRTPNNRAKS